jgi:hypothetical protein
LAQRGEFNFWGHDLVPNVPNVPMLCKHDVCCLPHIFGETTWLVYQTSSANGGQLLAQDSAQVIRFWPRGWRAVPPPPPGEMEHEMEPKTGVKWLVWHENHEIVGPMILKPRFRHLW